MDFLRWACTAVVWGALAAGAVAQEGQPVRDVILEGDVGVSHDLLRANMRTRPGVLYSPDLVDADSRWLHDTYGILAEVALEEGGVVRFRLVRVRRYVRVLLQGNDEIKTRDLLSAAQLAEGRPARPDEVFAARERIRDHYLQKGFAFVQVDDLVQSAGGVDREAVLRIFEGPEVEIVGFHIEGLVAMTEDEGLDRLDSPPGFWSWLVGKTFVRSAVDQDVVALEEVLRGEGYLDARAALAGLEYSADRSEVAVTLQVDEGERYTARSITVRGNQAFSGEELLGDAVLQPGAPYRRADLARLGRSLRAAYGREGYIDMQLDIEEVFDESEPLVDLVWTVDEGLRKRVRDVVVRGNVATRDAVVRRYISLVPGEFVDTDELVYSEDYLMAQEFFVDERGFPQVRVSTEPSPDPERVDVMVDVGEAGTGDFSFGLGAGSDIGLFGSIRLDKRNFDITQAASSWRSFLGEFFGAEAYHGGGQRLFLELAPGTERSTIDILFQDPWLDESRENPWGLSVSLHDRTRFFSDYDRRGTGLSVSFDHRLSRKTSISLGTSIERVDISNVDVAEVPSIAAFEGDRTSHALQFSWRYRDLDSVFEPTRGFSASSRLDIAGGMLGGEVDLRRLVLTGDWYTPFGESENGKVKVLHPRIALGAVDPTTAKADFPFYENFFVGGSAGPFAVRGFDFQGVGPHESNTALGGRLAAVGSLEASFPLVTQYNAFRDEQETLMKGILFTDMGYLSRAASFSGLGSGFRASVGGGVRLRLPALGGVTLSLELAFPLREQDGDDTRALSFELSRRF